MATIFNLDHLGAKFQVKITDCTTGDDIQTGNITSQAIVFYKPDGVVFEKDALLIEDPSSSGNFFVTYINGSEGNPQETISILDLIGKWEFTAKIMIDTDNFQTSERSIFWVS